MTKNWFANNGVVQPQGPGSAMGAGQMRFGGIAGTDQNVGEMNNTGIDLALQWSDASASGDFTYDIVVNLSQYKNEIVNRTEKLFIRFYFLFYPSV